MFNRTKAILVLIFTMLLLAVSAVAAPQTLAGTITDTMCGKKHMLPGKSDAECVRECMKSKGNWTYGLVVGDKVYGLAGDKRQFDAFAGKRVKVTGEVSRSSIAVQTITAATR